METFSEELQILMVGTKIGFFKNEEWRDWCEKVLLTSNQVDYWIVKLYESENNKLAYEALAEGWNKRISNDEPLDHVALKLGFLYLRYQRGDFGVAELLEKAGILTDGANNKYPDCETFYSLLNEYERRPNIKSTDPKTFTQRVEKEFYPFVNYLEKYLSNVQLANK